MKIFQIFCQGKQEYKIIHSYYSNDKLQFKPNISNSFVRFVIDYINLMILDQVAMMP